MVTRGPVIFVLVLHTYSTYVSCILKQTYVCNCSWVYVRNTYNKLTIFQLLPIDSLTWLLAILVKMLN